MNGKNANKFLGCWCMLVNGRKGYPTKKTLLVTIVGIIENNAFLMRMKLIRNSTEKVKAENSIIRPKKNSI